MVRWVVGSIVHDGPIELFHDWCNNRRKWVKDSRSDVKLHNHHWCNKGCGMYYPVCGMMHIKEPLLLIIKSSPCGGSGFPLSLSGTLPYV